MSKMKEKITLHPIMTFMVLIVVTILLSGILNLLDFETEVYHVNSTTLEYSRELVSVDNLLSLEGLKYIFSDTVANFVGFTPLSTLIIILIGIGVMEKSGFLKTAITCVTKKMKKNTVTFLLIFGSIFASVFGDLTYVAILPVSALIFKYGKRNPLIGVVAAFAGLTCGQGLSVIFTSVDSSLLSLSLVSARVIDIGYRMASISGVFIMLVAVLLLAAVLTSLTEKYIAPKFGKYEVEEEEEIEERPLNKRETRGLVFAGLAAGVYVLIFLYNIIPGLPFSGNLLDNSQTLYVDKLFSYNSFFSNGFVFIVTIFFIILGLFYGLGARNIKNHKEFIDMLGHSLDGIGRTLVLIFFASVFISLFRKTNIGTIIVGYLANIFRVLSFQGLPLILLLFVVSLLATIVLPSSISKWAVLSPVVIPVFMNAGISPEFVQVIFRFGESVTMGLTPLMAYFVVYLAMLNLYAKEDDTIGLFKAIRFQIPYAVVTCFTLVAILVLWYVVGLPLGINGITVL